MKVMERGIMKVVPSKVAEAMELKEKHMAIVSRLGMPATVRMYRPLVGGELSHTMITKAEWDSMAAMEAFFEKEVADPEMQELMSK